MDTFSKEWWANELMLKEESTPDRIGIIKDFVKFAIKELEISKDLPKISLSNDLEKARFNATFGYIRPDQRDIWIYIGRRNLADILRTLAHELVHHKQQEDGQLQPESGETGSDIENEANAQAGILLRKYGKINQNIYEIKINKPASPEEKKFTEQEFNVLLARIKNEFEDRLKDFNEFSFSRKPGMSMEDYYEMYGGHPHLIKVGTFYNDAMFFGMFLENPTPQDKARLETILKEFTKGRNFMGIRSVNIFPDMEWNGATNVRMSILNKKIST